MSNEISFGMSSKDKSAKPKTVGLIPEVPASMNQGRFSRACLSLEESKAGSKAEPGLPTRPLSTRKDYVNRLGRWKQCLPNKRYAIDHYCFTRKLGGPAGHVYNLVEVRKKADTLGAYEIASGLLSSIVTIELAPGGGFHIYEFDGAYLTRGYQIVFVEDKRGGKLLSDGGKDFLAITMDKLRKTFKKAPMQMKKEGLFLMTKILGSDGAIRLCRLNDAHLESSIVALFQSPDCLSRIRFGHSLPEWVDEEATNQQRPYLSGGHDFSKGALTTLDQGIFSQDRPQKAEEVEKAEVLRCLAEVQQQEIRIKRRRLGCYNGGRQSANKCMAVWKAQQQSLGRAEKALVEAKKRLDDVWMPSQKENLLPTSDVEPKVCPVQKLAASFQPASPVKTSRPSSNRPGLYRMSFDLPNALSDTRKRPAASCFE